MNYFVQWWKEFQQMIEDTPDIARVYISIGAMLVPIITCFLSVITIPFIRLIFNHLFYKEKINARKQIELWNKNSDKKMKNENLFFDNEERGYRFFQKDTGAYGKDQQGC